MSRSSESAPISRVALIIVMWKSVRTSTPDTLDDGDVPEWPKGAAC
jgi:hypothetical protein